MHTQRPTHVYGEPKLGGFVPTVALRIDFPSTEIRRSLLAEAHDRIEQWMNEEVRAFDTEAIVRREVREKLPNLLKEAVTRELQQAVYRSFSDPEVRGQLDSIARGSIMVILDEARKCETR